MKLARLKGVKKKQNIEKKIRMAKKTPWPEQDGNEKLSRIRKLESRNGRKEDEKSKRKRGEERKRERNKNYILAAGTRE